MESIIELVPVFKEKIWGGRKLETEFGYEIPAGPVGECWAISAHPAGDDEIASGEFAGHTLSWLWDNHRELFDDCPGDQFPLLIKIIDAQDDLSIQVHPDNAYAAEHENGSLGKKECWYVLSAEPGQTIVVGQRARTRAEFAQMVEAGRWSELLNEIPIKAGDFFQIDPGTVHAIKGGAVVLETQQSSDVTYRVYDYDRRQADGTLRPLHMQKALDVIDFNQKPLTSGAVELAGAVTTLEQNDCYTVDLVQVGEGAVADARDEASGCCAVGTSNETGASDAARAADVSGGTDATAAAGEPATAAAQAASAAVSAPSTLTVPTPHPFTCISVIEGAGTINGRPVKKGTHLLALAACDQLNLAGTMKLVLSYC